MRPVFSAAPRLLPALVPLLLLLAPGEVQALEVGVVQVHEAPHQVSIAWESDVPGTTEVYFGRTSQSDYLHYDSSSVWTKSFAGTRHGRTLCNLEPGRYYFRVRSTSSTASGVSDEGTFTVPVDGKAPLDLFVLDGKVSAFAELGDTVYFGGTFTNVAQRRGAGLPFDADAGVVVSDVPMVAGTVRAVAPDGAGGFFIGGDFSFVGGLPRKNAAHLLPDLGLDFWWTADLNGPVHAIAVSGDGHTLYLGGSFTTANGGTVRNLAAAVDATSGALTSWNPNVGPTTNNGAVYALAVSGSTVYLGGLFRKINEIPRNNAAQVDAATGAVTVWDPDLDDSVRAVVVNEAKDTVYLGGQFTEANGEETRNHAAAVDATTGVVTAWNPNLNSSVMALVVTDAAIYLGGSFETVNGNAPRSRAAAVDPTTGAVAQWNPNVADTVRALAVSDGAVYLGGDFLRVGTSPIRNRAAAVDANSGNLKPWNPNLGAGANAIAVSHGTVFVGGSFTSANGGTTRNHAGALDGRTGQLAAWNPNLNGNVYALAARGTTVYLGGEFSMVNDSTGRSRAAAVDGTDGRATAWNPDINQGVRAIAVDETTAYLGGHFTQAKGSTIRNHAAAFGLTTGDLLSWNPNLDSYVSAIAVSGNTVYLGGAFQRANGGAPRNYAAAVGAIDGNLISWDPNPNRTVNALVVSGSTVYLAGSFYSVGGTAARSAVAAVDPASGSPTAWSPTPGFLSVYAMGFSGSTVFLGGSAASTTGGPPARWTVGVGTGDGAVTSWDREVFDDGHSSLPGAAVLARCSQNRVYFGGDFFLGAGSTPQSGILTLTCDADAGVASADAGTIAPSGDGGADGGSNAGGSDAGAVDGGSLDGGAAVDAGARDAGSLDAGSFDAGAADGGAAVDAGSNGDQEVRRYSFGSACSSSSAGSLLPSLALGLLLALRRRHGH